MITLTVFFIPKAVTVAVAIYDSVFFHALSIVHIYLCLQWLIPCSSWHKFALCIQSLLCMLFLFRWPLCQRSDMILLEVSQCAYDMIHYISGLYGYLYVCEIYVNLIWYLYLFMLNKFCLSLSLSHTVQCRQTAVNFLTNIHKKHPIAHLLGRGMGCL